MATDETSTTEPKWAYTDALDSLTRELSALADVMACVSEQDWFTPRDGTLRTIAYMIDCRAADVAAAAKGASGAVS